MFTGIVEALGEVVTVEPATGGGGARLRVRAGGLAEGARAGDSIAVDGVCLTITAQDGGVFTADLAAETLRRTTLGRLRPGDRVNLERPLRVDQRLGGHIVQGHVDGVGTVAAVRPEGDGAWMEITPPPALLRYLVEKGSVAVDGVSLTVAALPAPDRFAVALVPHTLAATTLGRRRPGDAVNLEADILAKYVQRLLEGARQP
ncbi:MAG: riboflavin synthase [Armatimonadota bacterium]|nr:riboflavin synthase [Armatimonadota bacterium]MDR7533285.1 riboflavin synthase [Armatimonadota bacterium]MDR7536922.1 riboflavin synthase [Armatimonadota bacterium]